LAEKNKVKFMIEGTVMSGTPVLNLANGPLFGNKITAAKGILNGTTNFILTKMEEGMDYKDALAEAQKLGYAEADRPEMLKVTMRAQKLQFLQMLLWE
jgi:homoserine dehydrogenase